MLNKNRKKSGLVCRLIWMEFLMIIRTERSRRLILLFLLAQVGLVLIGIGNNNIEIKYSAIAEISIIANFLVLQGLFGVSYGQYNFAWDAPHFSLFFTQNLSLRIYLTSKMLTLMLVTFAPCLFIIPWFIDSPILMKYICCLAYNCGTIPLFVIFIALFNYKRINIHSKNLFSNYEGMGKIQHALGFLIYLLPISLIIIGLIVSSFQWIYYLLLIIGLLNISLLPFWNKKFAVMFQKKKYIFLTYFNVNYDTTLESSEAV
ncbi:MAG: DUF5687 family protein [Agriterribacter sp.]